MKNAKQLKNGHRLPTLVAIGGSLAALPAAAVELGELTVQSRLGDPLRASIAFALGANESVNNSCVSVAPVANGWPGIGQARVAIGNGVITIAGTQPMREPMVSTRLVVNCPYSANISREYTLFIDPPSYVAPQAETPVTAAPVAVAPAATPPRPSVVEATQPAAPQASLPPRTRPVTPVADIAISDRIRVQPGDSASQLVARIEGRTMKLWSAVYALVDANPDAFIDGDPNRLKAGAWLNIPAAIGGVVEATSQATVEFAHRNQS